MNASNGSTPCNQQWYANVPQSEVHGGGEASRRRARLAAGFSIGDADGER